jgi:hypothetical protein
MPADRQHRPRGDPGGGRPGGCGAQGTPVGRQCRCDRHPARCCESVRHSVGQGGAHCRAKPAMPCIPAHKTRTVCARIPQQGRASFYNAQ